MKKACAALLALLLCLCLATPALAEEIEPTPIPVVTEPTPEASPAEEPVLPAADAPIYSVNVTWGATEFVYQAVRIWSPQTLTYAESGGWSPESGSVAVENGSSAPVVATLTAGMNGAAPGVGVALFGEASRQLAVGASEIFIYSLTGAPDAAFTAGVIGSLTVTITAPGGETQ